MKYVSLILVSFAPVTAFAAESESVLRSLLVNVGPLVLFILVWVFLMKSFAKAKNPTNERLVELSEEMAVQLKRIADSLEKKN